MLTKRNVFVCVCVKKTNNAQDARHSPVHNRLKTVKTVTAMILQSEHISHASRCNPQNQIVVETLKSVVSES